MGGEGSILAMIISSRNNRDLLKNRRKFMNKDMMSDPVVNYPKVFSDKKISHAKLMRVRRRIKAAREEEIARLILTFIISAGIGVALIMIIINRFSLLNI
jgi:hypothetical protein